MPKSKVVIYFFIGVIVYFLLLRPALFWMHSSLFYPLLQFVGSDISVALAGRSQHIYFELSDGTRIGWGMMFSVTTLMIPAGTLWLIQDSKKMLMVIYLHIFISLLTLIIFIFALLWISQVGVVNTIFYNYILLALSYGLTAVGFSEWLKKRKS